ncbi:MAG: hypothetical protein FWD05_00650 [Oscillospiraceae bacterium]|nr:hypothetical protein [Oscillospiraceae bacterium]
MQNNIEKNRLKLNILILFALALSFLFFLYLTTTVNVLPRIGMIRVGYFYAFGWILPGVAIMAILNFKKLSFTEVFGLGCVVGYCYNIALYYLLFPFGLGNFTSMVVLIVGLASIVIIILKRKYLLSLFFDRQGFIICTVFFVLIMVLKFFVFDLESLLPTAIPLNVYYQDLLFWIGDAAALSHSYPPLSVRMDGMARNYHYFSSIQMVVMNAVTGVSFVRIGFAYQYLMPPILLSFSAYMFVKRVVPNNKYVVLFMLVLFFCLGERISLGRGINSFPFHMFIWPWGGFNIALAISMFVFFLLTVQMEQTKTCIKCVVLAAVLVGVLTGTKAPNAVVAIAGGGVLCLFWIIKQRQVKNAIIYGISCLIAFVAVYLLVIYAPGRVGDGTSNIFGHIGLVLELNEALLLLGDQASNSITLILSTLQWSFWVNSTIYIIFFIGIILSVVHWRRIDAIEILAFSVALAGLACTLMFFHHGVSQIYYIQASFPFALLFGIYCIYKYREKLLSNKTQRAVLGSVMSLFIVSGLITSYYRYLPFVISGVEKLRHRTEEPLTYLRDNSSIDAIIGDDCVLTFEHPNALTNSDYEALTWLRDNSPYDALVAGDRFLVTEINLSFITSAFSERRVFIEGIGFMRVDNETRREAIRRRDIMINVMHGDVNAISELKSEGVDYLIRTNWLFPYFDLPEDMGYIVFANESVTIYSLGS